MRSGSTTQSKCQLPRLANQVFSERVVALLLAECETNSFVDPPRRCEHTVGPQGQSPASISATTAS